MKKPSLLSRTIAQTIFEEYKKDFSRDGHITPALHVFRDIDGTGIPVASVVEVEPPNDPAQKQMYFSRIRENLQRKGTILEVLYIFEGWATLRNQSSQRKEILGMMGRNKEKTRLTMVQQKFSRTSDGKVIWEDVTTPQYNVPVTVDGQFRLIGVIDYLFPPLN
jgi:hypothetical protein